MASNVKVNKITPTSACGTITLGDSGDTISIPSGASLSIGGTVSGIDGVVNWDTTAKTTGFTAVAGNGYFVNTTSGAITVTLPATPTAGDLVAVKDYALTAQTNNITLGRNGSNIQGVANDFIINTQGRSVTLIYVDGTQGWMLTGASQASDIVSPSYIVATGGTITTCGDYKIHTFTSPGTFTVCSVANPIGGPNNVDYLVVAGGGGTSPTGNNGTWGGGGGAGGYRTSYPSCGAGSIPVSVSGYPITVGAGGTSPGTPGDKGGNGSNSVFSTITSAGGGGGSYYAPHPNGAGAAGGSGGGGGGCGAGAGGAGNTPPVSPSQGNNGGSGKLGAPEGGGGGGGIGATGSNGSPSGGGAGGIGSPNTINPSPTVGTSGPAPGRYFSGGGGGSNGRRDLGGNPTVPGGAGGGGTGGSGINTTSIIPGTNGTTNTGGGGGAAGTSGGSGIVIIRYKYQ